MNKEELKDRTKQFALRCIKLSMALPKNDLGHVIRRQLIRCSSSVGANYRAACRGRSTAEFISKLGIVLEETDECSYWLELVVESGSLPKSKVTKLLSESEELTAIFFKSIQTAKRKSSKS